MHPNGASILEQLSEAYTENFDALYRHCYFRTFSTQDAEEVVQDAFMSACEYLRRGKIIQSPKLFLYRIANNLIIDRARRLKTQRKHEISLDELTEKGIDPMVHDGTGHVQRRIEARNIMAASKKLRKDDYNLLVMRYIDGLMPNDIASLTGMSANNVSVRLHRILKQLSASIRYTQA